MDSSVDFSRENFPDLKIIELGENRGFSGGNLAGLGAAKGEFIALVNNDTRADQKWLQTIIQWRPYFRAKWDALRLVPVMWKKRKEIQRRKRVSNFYMKSIMTSLFTRELIGRKIRQFIRG
jgi:hypothetical protein